MQYNIEGGQLPVLICTLDSGDSMITESGSMGWMTPNIEMVTSGGGAKKVLGRMLSGESLFRNIYTARGNGAQIAFLSSFPGSIVPIDVRNEDYIVQKTAFLASDQSVELSMFFQKKFGAGLVGGEGFVMQRLSGSGMAFIEIDGAVIEYTLAAGQQMVVSTGHLAYMSGTCSINVSTVKGAKNILLGGEGLFNTVITGPGKIGLQTLSPSDMASAIAPFLPSSNK
ncbi:MAG: AIM24 family protein [Peptostreptococcaceae bacterium]|nr:AIM24 family protein [Peptostreptococcaceae bacterium]